MQDNSATVSPPPIRTRSRSITLFVALLAFVLGGGLVAWAASHGYLSRMLQIPDAQETAAVVAEPEDDATGVQGPAVVAPPTAEQMAALGSVEGRLAMLEDRLSRADFETQAASSNATRAEGLLIAFAARRMIDRGEPLSYVADQLRLRFMDAQPHAVDTIISFSAKPVTLDELTARLEALSSDLTQTSSKLSLWNRARAEMSSLFTVHRESPELLSPAARIGRARMMLTARRIDPAIGEVERLPGAEAANTWIADARRYRDVQRALDLLETTAMLEPNRLQDAAGHKADKPSPLATPAPVETTGTEPSF